MRFNECEDTWENFNDIVFFQDHCITFADPFWFCVAPCLFLNFEGSKQSERNLVHFLQDRRENKLG